MAIEPKSVPPATNPNGAMGFFHGLPAWARASVTILTIVPLAIALSGQILGLQAGEYVGKYLDIQLESMKELNTASTQKILDAMSTRAEQTDARLADVDARVGNIEVWACTHSDQQKLVVDKPEFCK